MIIPTVNDDEFRITSVSATSISRDYSSSDSPCIERNNDSIAQAHIICFSERHQCGLQVGL